MGDGGVKWRDCLCSMCSFRDPGSFHCVSGLTSLQGLVFLSYQAMYRKREKSLRICRDGFLHKLGVKVVHFTFAHVPLRA